VQGLLRRHVAPLSERDLAEGARGQDVGAGQTEVGDLHRAVEADQHVVRREIAVDEADGAARAVLGLVDVRQRLQHPVGDVEADRHRHAGRGGVGPIEQGREAAPVHVLHRDVVDPVHLAVVEAAHHVLMVDVDHDLRLVAEAVHEGLVVDVVGEDGLDDAAVAQAARDGEEDLAHAPRREGPLEEVVPELAGEGVAE
jgi:hypothetical protein